MDKVICIGKNYPAHAAELGETQPENPVLFLKPRSTIGAINSSDIELDFSYEVIHHELEIVFRLSVDTEQNVTLAAVTLGLDLTKRELQQNLKKLGQPWEISKVFANSALLCRWLPINEWPKLSAQEFWLKVNGEVRQKAFSQSMFYKPLEAIAYAKKFFPIIEGDLLFTGTPPGVGPLKSGDQIELGWGSQQLGTSKLFDTPRVTN
jgi:2-keto-4-pentenoate hydratase/2-oxohepta-3-ene-1,7-dioic acid hydratase in catechol pathway